MTYGLWPRASSTARDHGQGLRDYRNENHWGILIVRLHQPNEQRIHVRVMAALRQFPESDWRGLLVVMRDSVQSLYRPV
jgi:hypothetical protein